MPGKRQDELAAVKDELAEAKSSLADYRTKYGLVEEQRRQTEATNASLREENRRMRDGIVKSWLAAFERSHQGGE